ncbi:hypothetical protein [Amycolatopsis anabasis]|uniref:hypothetical protein n=1 Tax=Amycolatopsis anabasis TaxID=1840409 RepID=UPI00131A799F|nr:hypothetical protein [Amycolatopsis anabasis]
MRKTTLAGAGLALILTLTACGGGSGDGGQAAPQPAPAAAADGPFTSATDLVRAASAKTTQSKTAKFSMEAGGGGQTMKAQGQLRIAGENVEMAMVMDAGGQNLEVRLIDRAFYVKAPEAAEPGKPWAKLSLDGQDPLSKLLGGMMDQAAKQSDPTKLLDQMQKAGTITKSEPAQLDGQATTLYHLDVDLAKAMDQSLESMPKEIVAQVKDKLDKELKGKKITMPMQVWLNSEQLPVQIVVDSSEIAKAAGAPAGQQEMKATIKYTDWGGAVDVQVPPADQVKELKMPEIPGAPKPTR